MHSGFQQLQLAAEQFHCSTVFCFDGCHYQVNSNSKSLLKSLTEYFSGYESPTRSGDINIYLYEDAGCENPIFKKSLPWQNWTGEVGKTRLKEQYLDVVDGRWIHKYKTGMVMFQHLTSPLAIGPCSHHLSQMVNFIINQHINHLQQTGGLICHAACVQVGETGIAIAAHSGGGKSTTMLKLMDLPDSRFISNDRLFLFSEEQQVLAKGVPKQPRVNPGTLLNNPRLRAVLPERRQAALSALTPQQLWQQEEKYDVMMADIYGESDPGHATQLDHVILLNWQPGGTEPVQLTRICLDNKPELIAAIAKSPGSFYQNSQGEFLHSAEIPAAPLYLDALRQVQVWEVTGGANFEKLISLLQTSLF